MVKNTITYCLLLLFSFGCGRNCDDVVCMPCPEFNTHFEVFQFKIEGDSAFLATDLDTIWVYHYINGIIDRSFNVVDEYFYNEYYDILTNEMLKIPEYEHNVKTDSIVVEIPQIWKATITDSHFTGLETKPSCCGCGQLMFDSLRINSKIIVAAELPHLVTKE